MKDYTDELEEKGFCPNCRLKIDDLLICPGCGYDLELFWINTKKKKKKSKYCPNHPNNKSEYLCGTCGVFYCEKCIVGSGGRGMPYNYKKYYTCKKCLEIIENPPLKPRPNICAFHPIGVNKISTEKTADSETNICESCINKTKRCKKCGLPLYYHEDLELNKDVLCYGCRKSLKWWELLKYPKIG